MKTVGEARLWLKEKLKDLFSAEELPELQFLILNFITGMSRTQQHVSPEKQLSEQQIRMLLLSAQKLDTRMPIQYVLGEADFFGLKFAVNQAVLIPRPETEELVSWVLEEKEKSERRKGERLMAESLGLIAILDIGTGSGCISIAIKKNWPEAIVSGLDISAEALQTAHHNALQNEVEVDLFQQDILNFYPVKEASYSIIVSNPPYIVPSEKTLMQPNVLNFEPHLALFVPETDPLLFYRAVANYAWFRLEENGLLFFEINPKFQSELNRLLHETGFIDITVKYDFRGQARMVRALKP